MSRTTKQIFIAAGAAIILLLFLFCGRTVIAASESLSLDTKTHKVISPLTIDWAGVTILNWPIPGGVASVFGRTGAVLAQSGDYSTFYAPLAAALPTGGTTGQVLTKTTATNYAATWQTLTTPTPAPTPPVTSVFTRTGAVVAAANDYTFAQIGSKPTTLAGYGITDPVLLSTGSYANPAWLTSLAWSKITGAPAFEVPLTFNQSLTRATNTVHLVGDIADPASGPDANTNRYYGMNTSNVRGFYQLPAGAVSSVFGRTGAVVAASNDYTFAQIGSKPTTLSGYGITDPVALTTAANIFTAEQTATAFTMTVPSSTAKARLAPLPGVPNWVGYSLNIAGYQLSAPQGWLLDDTTVPGWTMQLDSRSGQEGFFIDMIPAGPNPHTDQTHPFKIDITGLVTVANRITGVGTPTGATDAATKGYVDTNFEAPLTFNQSLTRATNTVHLVGDIADPASGADAGTNRYYGINTANVRGFYQLPAGAVSSVFGRTGAVVAASNDYTFAQIGSKPTTLAGYGISDPVALTNAANVFSLNQTMPTLTLPLPSSTAKGRLTGLTGVANWLGYTLNASFSGGWNLDDTSVYGWFFKLDSRPGLQEFATYVIPPGANPHSDEYKVFGVTPAGVMTVTGRITGVGTPTGATDAATKGYVDTASSTLSNKTLDDTNTATFKDANFTLENATDTTKKAKFALQNIPTGVQVAINVPANNSTMVVPYAAPNSPTQEFLTAINADGTCSSAIPSGGGNVSNSGTPTSGQVAEWVTATSIKGVTNPSITAIRNLTGNGFIKTSGAIGTLSVDTSNYLTGNQTITLSGDLSGSGTTSIAATVTPVTGTGNFVKSASPTFTGTVVAATINPTNITGTTTNDSAAAGSVGQFVESKIPFGSAVVFTSNTARNITTISLTAGDWDVSGVVTFVNGSGTTSTLRSGGINTTSATEPSDGSEVSQSMSVAGSAAASLTFPRVRISVSATTTVYLVGKLVFSGGQGTGYGIINARRVR